MQSVLRIIRFPLLLVGMCALLFALWGGLGRLGWGLSGSSGFMMIHGPLMVGGFLGTLISVERAVALGTYWAYLAPVLTAMGALACLVGLPASPLFLAGSLGLTLSCVAIVRRQPDMSTVIMAVGAATWVIGNSGWYFGWPLPHVVPWWGGFLILTIAGERLELSRMLRLLPAQRGAFALACLVIVGGLLMTLTNVDRGIRLYGAGMMALAWWLLRYDIARRTVKQQGVTRYIALCLLSGYVWLGLGGILTWYFGGILAGFSYDAMLHAVFLGFVFAMIFGHAPIIFPAVLGHPVSYQPLFYAPLLGLHLSLGLRLAGDLGAWSPGRLWGGLLNALILVAFFVILGASLLRGARGGKPVSTVLQPPPAK